MSDWYLPKRFLIYLQFLSVLTKFEVDLIEQHFIKFIILSQIDTIFSRPFIYNNKLLLSSSLSSTYLNSYSLKDLYRSIYWFVKPIMISVQFFSLFRELFFSRMKSRQNELNMFSWFYWLLARVISSVLMQESINTFPNL